MKVKNMLFGLLISAQVFAVDYFHCDKCGKTYRIDASKNEFQMKDKGKIISVNNMGVSVQEGKNVIYVDNSGKVLVNYKAVDYELDFRNISRDAVKEIATAMQECHESGGLVMEKK